MQVVERDFTLNGKMKPVSKQDRKRLQGHLPFYSVDTREEAEALTEYAILKGEFLRQADGSLIERTLMYDQTLENLSLAGERLAALHEQLKESNCDNP